MVVFDSKVINHQRKDDVAGDVTEETGGGGLVKVVGGKVREKIYVLGTACLPPLIRTSFCRCGKGGRICWRGQT
jgi:hypothetical protein